MTAKSCRNGSFFDILLIFFLLYPYPLFRIVKKYSLLYSQTANFISRDIYAKRKLRIFSAAHRNIPSDLLQSPELIKLALLFHKLRERTRFYAHSLLYHGNLVGVFNGGKPVRDYKRRMTL